MEFTESNELCVTREYTVNCSEVVYYFSKNSDKYHQIDYYETDPLDITLDKIKSSWKIILATKRSKLYACLHKISSSSNDFIVTACFFKASDILIKKQYDAGLFENGDWILLKDDNLTRVFDIKIILREKPLKEKSLEEAQYDQRKELLLTSESFNDFKFICSDGATVLGNRAILSQYSTVFKTMLDVPMTESTTQTAKLEDIDGETMEEVMRFLLTGRVNDIKDNALFLLYCAEKYAIDDLKKYCLTTMMRCIDLDNVVEYMLAAYRYKEMDLYRRCLFCVECYYDVIDKAELSKLDPLHLGTIEYNLNRDKSQKVYVALKHINSYSPVLNY